MSNKIQESFHPSLSTEIKIIIKNCILLLYNITSALIIQNIWPGKLSKSLLFEHKNLININSKKCAILKVYVQGDNV